MDIIDLRARPLDSPLAAKETKEKPQGTTIKDVGARELGE
jgi:hypothetical protein